MRRLRSWSGSPRSRARESIAKSTFIRKTHMIWKTFFRVFAERSPTPYFYNEISPSRGPSFHNFDSKMAKLHFWPKRGQWDPMWSEFDSIWIKFDPNWVKLGPNEAQSIFTNSRSTAQADVMLIKMSLTESGTGIFPAPPPYPRKCGLAPHPPYTPGPVQEI